MEKRIALLKDGVVFNIIIGNSSEEMATLFNCQAIEVTSDTLQAYIGYGFIDGVFDGPEREPDVINELPPVAEMVVVEEEVLPVEENL